MKAEPRSDDYWVICPHCGHKHGDAPEWVTEQEEKTECDACGKEFYYYAETTTVYHTRPGGLL